MPGEVLVVGEIADGQISPTTRELLAAGRQVADDAGVQLAVALAGSAPEEAARDAGAAGADKAYAVQHSLLANYQIDLHLSAFESVCRQVEPGVVLTARSNVGRELAPRLAARLGVGLAQDCLEVKWDADGQRLLANRPVYGGSAIAVVACVATPQMACIRPKTYEPLDPDHSRQAEVVQVPVELDASIAKVRVVSVVAEESEGVKLEEARIVVSGGRGLGGPEPFTQIEELASVLSAGVGASRAAVDSGWVPPAWQVGLTGKTITPDLYITVGISGASQHMAGCSGAKVLVAINKDSGANIFKECRYGVVGDWQKVLPAFTEAVRELLQS